MFHIQINSIFLLKKSEVARLPETTYNFYFISIARHNQMLTQETSFKGKHYLNCSRVSNTNSHYRYSLVQVGRKEDTVCKRYSTTLLQLATSGSVGN